MNLSYTHFWQGATDPQAPVLLLLHGTGGNEHDLVGLGQSLWPGAALLSPRGDVNEAGMLRFFRRVGEGIFDQDDLTQRSWALAKFVAEAAQAYGFDPARVVAVGFSNGANFAASLLLKGTGTLAGAVLLSAIDPQVPDPQPDLAGVRVFLGEGENDPLVPRPRAEALIGKLTAAGAAVETFWHPGGHQLTRPELEAAALWLRHFQGGN